MKKYNLTLDNGRVVEMQIVEGYSIEDEILKYESSLPVMTDNDEVNKCNLAAFGDILPKKVASYLEIK